MNMDGKNKTAPVEPLPLVSILINNYNYATFLASAIDSALNQTYSSIEIIVVDDGSIDHSREVISQYGEKIIPVFKNNGGQASAFNAGFAVSRGEIICFLDADDVFLPNKVQEVVDIFNQYQNAEWIFHPLTMVNSALSMINPSQECKQTVYACDVRQDIRKGNLRGRLPLDGTATSGTVFRRSLLTKILPMPEEIRITSDDYIKYLTLGLAEGVVLMKEVALQRLHDNNAYTSRTDKSQLRAEVSLLTAYWLKKNFGFLAPFTHKIFAFGFATYSSNQNNSARFEQIIREYLAPLSWLDRQKINFRSTFYAIKFNQ